MGFLTPYYHGKHKWEDYLLDIQHAIEVGNATLQEQTFNAFDFQKNLISSLEEMNAEFEWGFSLIASWITAQSAQLSEISETLDDIYDALKAPLGNRAGELFRWGEDYHRKGLLVEALRAYRKAEKRNPVNFTLQFQLGMLLLYGRNKTDNVINLPEAERHFLLAARYANAEKNTTSDWHKYCSKAYFQAAVAAYLISEETSSALNLGMMRSCLGRALEYLKNAATLCPQFTATIYTQAKCYALLGQNQKVLEKMKSLSDSDRRYLAKASLDKDFDSIFPEIETIFKQALISPGPHAQTAAMQLQKASEGIEWARRSKPSGQQDVAIIDSIESAVLGARQSLLTLEVNIDHISREPKIWINKLTEISEKSFEANIRIIQNEIDQLEAQDRNGKDRIKRLQSTKSDTSGAGWGCLTSFIALLVFTAVGQLFVNRYQVVLLSYFGTEDIIGATLTVGDIVLVLMVGFAVAAVVRSHSERKHQRRVRSEIEKITAILNDCAVVLSGTRQRSKNWQKEFDSFRAWKANVSKDSGVLSFETHA